MQASADIAIARHFDDTFRLVENDRVTRHDHYFRLITGEPHPLGNLVILRPESTFEEAQDALEPLCSASFPSSAIFLEEAAPEVREYLEGAGFESHGNLPGMTVETDRVTPTELPRGYRFARVGVEESDAWTEALARGYDLPKTLAQVFSPEALNADMSDDAAIQWYAIYKGSQIVAVANLMLHSDLAGIYCVATLEEERGKGLGAHITAEPLRIAQKLGYSTGILQSSEMGFPVYERLGFVAAGDGLPLFVRMPEV
jgi:GNAT superfamily N-acetyltransferase